MTVQTIIDRKGNDVATAGPQNTVAEIVKMLADRRIGAIVITGADRRIVGIVSERDVVRVLAQRGPACLEDPVSLIMSRGVVDCSPSEKVNDVMRKMTEGRFRHVPVTVDGKLVGIVSIGDVVKHRMMDLESEASAMRDYIVMG
jgi:CBS domain-containing protein